MKWALFEIILPFWSGLWRLSLVIVVCYLGITGIIFLLNAPTAIAIGGLLVIMAFICWLFGKIVLEL